MFKTRTRKIISDIMSRKGRTALVSLAIFIGVFGVVALFSMSGLIVSQLEKDIIEDKLAMLNTGLTIGGDAQAPDNAAFLQQMSELPGVITVEGHIFSQLYFKKSGADDFEQGGLFSYYGAMDQVQLEPMRLLEGAYPVAGQNQIAIERRMAEEYGLAVGDPLVLRLVSQATGDTVPEETWTISAIVFQPYTMPLSESDMTSAVFSTFEDAQYITGVQAFTDIATRFVDFKTAEAQATAYANTIATTTSYVPFVNWARNPAENEQITGAKSTGNVLGILGLVALVVSGFLVINVVNSIVVEQKRQIGVMKSLGATQWDNFYIYSGIALGYGIIGVIPGVILGIPAGYFAAQALATTMETYIEGFGLVPSAILLGAGVGLAIPVLASLIPVFNGTRVKVLDAMTDLGIDSNYGKGPLVRLISKLPVSITVRQGLSNVSQKKGRLTFTVVTLAIAAGAFMGIFALFFSINDVLNNLFDTYQVEIFMQPDQPQDFDEISNLLLTEVDGIKSVQPSNGLQVDIEGFTPAAGSVVFINGFDPDVENPVYQIEFRDGGLWGENSDPNGVILSASIADAIGKEVGDTIVISGAGNQIEAEIVGISSFPFDQVWMRWQALSTFAGYDVNGAPVSRAFMIQMDGEDITAKQTTDKIDEINEVLLSHGITATYQNFPELIDGISSLIQGFQIIFNLSAVLIALVGALGLLTTLSMSVFERQKEIGVMRSIGASSGTVATQFLTEGVVVGIIAWGVGLPISFGLSILIVNALNLDEFIKLSYPISAPISGLIGMTVITIMASLYPSLSAARKTVSDILRYQ